MSENKDIAQATANVVNKQSGSDAKPEETQEVLAKVHSDKITATIVIDGKPKEIKKLKAGKFYKAQEVFTQIFKMLISSGDFSQIDGSKIQKRAQELGKNIEELTPQDFPQDEANKITEIMNKSEGAGIFGVIAEAQPKMSEFVAICAEMPLDQLLEDAYPHEINDAFRVCYELNDVMENLKKLGNPMRM